MDARRGRCCVAVLAFLMPVWAAAAGPASVAAPDRFGLVSVIRPVARSDDARFGLTAQVRAVPAATSLDQRFTLKAVNVPAVGCDPLAGDIFANGFEGP